MKIKEEPIDLDYESPLSQSSHVICALQTLIDASKIKLESSSAGSSENHLQDLPNENLVHRPLEENNPVVSSQMPALVSTSGSTYHGSSLPACENYSGRYNFTVSFNHQEKNTKGVAWTYSKIKDKLYVDKDAPCPINFSANTVLPNDTCIRAMALYTAPEQVSEVVTRCINHSMDEMKAGRIEAQHLIRCESSSAEYITDEITKRHSVVVPFENPPVGQQYSTYIYKFACFGSCNGGPNRRPLMLIFTLERNNQVIGRRKLDVKICACPGRDRKNDEAQHLANEVPAERVMSVKRKQNPEGANLSDIMAFTKNIHLPPLKKSKVMPDKDGAYIINTEDKGCYDFLRQMMKLYEICNALKGASPDTVSKAINYIQKTKNEKNDQHF